MENFDRQFELTGESRELIARARRARLEERVPDAARQRIVARALGEAHNASPIARISPAELVPVAASGSRASLVAAALAAAIALPVYVRETPEISEAPEAEGDVQATAEPPRGAPSRAAREASERLLRAPLFKAPAGVLGEKEPPPYGPSLLGDRPFSQLSDSWQVRRWNDLTRDPTNSAVYDFDEGALCVTLEAGERVLGGWPWTQPEVIAPEAVPLSKGKRYRLTLTAWAHEPVPAQLLVALGHSRLPFSAAAGARVPVSEKAERYVVDFTAQSADPSIGVAFLATNNGEDAERTRVCVSDVTLHAR